MDIFLFSSLFILFVVTYTIIGLWSSRQISTTEGYFLADRDLGVWSVLFTLVATQIGGGMLLGTAQQAYAVGLYGILYTVGMVIGFIILGSGIAQKLQTLQVTTTAELFQTYYNSNTLKKCASVLSILTMSGILISQIVGARSLLLSIGFINEPIFILFWLFTIGYTMMGGLKAVVYTDIFQVLFIILVFSGIFVSILVGDFSGVWATFASQHYFEVPHMNQASMVATLLMPALFSLIEQDLAQRFFAAKSARVAKLAAFGASGFLLLFSLVPVYFGMYAQQLGIDVNLGMSPLIPVLQTLVSDFVLILAVIAIIAAIVSTADSLLCAVGSNISNDLELEIFPGSRLAQARYISLSVGLVALAASYIVPQNIIGLIIESYEISVSCLLVPLLAVYFGYKKSSEAAWGAVIFGFVSFVLFRFWQPPVAREICSIALSLIGFCLGHMSNRFLKK